MERIPVSSTNIASIGYVADSLTLEVEFTNMAVYQYQGVPPEVHEAFMNAPSKGTFLHQSIKDQYPYIKL